MEWAICKGPACGEHLKWGKGYKGMSEPTFYSLDDLKLKNWTHVNKDMYVS